MPEELERLIASAVGGGIEPFDPRDPEQGAAVRALADRLLGQCPDAGVLAGLEEALVARGEGVSLSSHLAVKLARSKSLLRGIGGPVHASIVFAAYKENTRMLRPEEHPHGEDCIVRKIAQLDWLCGDGDGSGGGARTWDLTVVDDGCPEGSGELAERILAERCPDAPAQVLFLEAAIREGLPVTRPMTSAADSQKGGSVAYGMWAAAQVDRGPARHVVIFTDADLSTHLGQVGLLVDAIVNGGKDAAIGSRRQPTSVVVKKGHRNTRGKLFIYLWKGLIKPLHHITDTQCGFKGFDAPALREIVEELTEKRFAIDIELLLKTELRRGGSVGKVPVAWIDSEAASTTTSIGPYLAMLRSVAGFYRKYLPADPGSDQLADFIESLTDEEWTELSENVPAPIADGDPTRFSEEREVSVEELAKVIRR